MQFEPSWRPIMHVIGLSVRTTNAREADPATGEIGGLWARFMAPGLAELIPRVIDATVLYGVYTDYASDVDGEYTLILGRSVDEHAAAPEGFTKVTLPAGSYVVGTSEGAMPQAVIDGWRAVWEYFAQPDAPRRAYTADLEVYRAETPNEVELYIAVT